MTNELSRAWLEERRAFARAQGGFETLSLLEPHKKMQNSLSVFQKRGAAWPGEPVFSKYP